MLTTKTELLWTGKKQKSKINELDIESEEAQDIKHTWKVKKRYYFSGRLLPFSVGKEQKKQTEVVYYYQLKGSKKQERCFITQTLVLMVNGSEWELCAYSSKHSEE